MYIHTHIHVYTHCEASMCTHIISTRVVQSYYIAIQYTMVLYMQGAGADLRGVQGVATPPPPQMVRVTVYSAAPLICLDMHKH